MEGIQFIMLEFLKNDWVIGVGTTIISTTVISLWTRWFTKRNQNKRYMLANQEVMNCLRPIYLNLIMPNRVIIETVISSVARQFSFSKKELNSVENVEQDIFTEIVSNNFLSIELKNDFMEAYEVSVKEDREVSAEVEKEMYHLRAARTRSTYKSNLLQMYTSIIGLFSLILMLLMMYTFLSEKNSSLYLSSNIDLWIVILTLGLTMYFCFIFFVVYFKNRLRINKMREIKTRKN